MLLGHALDFAVWLVLGVRDVRKASLRCPADVRPVEVAGDLMTGTGSGAVGSITNSQAPLTRMHEGLPRLTKAC